MTLPFLNKIKVASTSRIAKGELAVVQVGFFIIPDVTQKNAGCVLLFQLELESCLYVDVMELLRDSLP